MSETTIKRSGQLAIRPYLENASPNMGLEKYSMSVFEGVFHEEQIACLEQNGIKRYVTGMNEFAPEIKNLEPEAREAAAKEIRKIVAQLEKELATNIIEDINDPDFWNKVKLLRPNNDEFWSKIVLRIGNEPVFLNPAADPYDLIKLKAIESGGFTLVAKSLEAARAMAVPPKFYLDKYEDSVASRTEVTKLRNKAKAALQNLYDTNVNKLFYVCKVVDIDSAQYRKSTPNDIMYENMDRYIDGGTVDRDKRKTAQRFLDVTEQDMETLMLRALVKDATYYKMIATKGDGFIYHMKSATNLGKNPTDIVEFLKNPLNEDILMDLQKSVEKYWNV